MINVDRGKGGGEGGPSFDSVSADFLIYMYFFHSGLLKKKKKIFQGKCSEKLKVE